MTDKSSILSNIKYLELKGELSSNEFWESFIKNYSRLLASIIIKTFNYYNFIFNPEHLSDCNQDIILQIFNKKETIFGNYNSEKSKFTTYLSVIVTRATIDYLNKNKKYYANVELKDSVPPSGESAIGYKHIEESIIDKEEDISFEDILKSGKLTDREKLILKMIFIKEMTSKEVGDFLNISESTVRVTKKKAIGKLKKSIKTNTIYTVDKEE